METVVRIFSILTGIFLISCSEEDSKPFKSGKQPKLSIEDASGIVVYDAAVSSGGRIATQSSNLYKITANGNLEQVRALYEDNSEIGSSAPDLTIRVDYVYNINENYFVLDGEFIVWDTLGNPKQFHTLLVRKTDGAIFEFRHPSHYGSDIHRSDALQDETFHADQNGNFYYLSISQKVLKVDVTDLSNLFMVDYLPTGQNTPHYSIDQEGNCIYRTSYKNEFRIRKAGGGIHEILPEGIADFWIGSNGKIYFSDWGIPQPSIYQVSFDASEIGLHKVWKKNQGNSVNSGVYDRYQYFKIRKQHSTVFVGLGDYNHWEFFEESNTVVEFYLPELTQGAKVVSSDDYYYIATGTNLYKVSQEDHSFQNMLIPGQYEVYNMSVSNDNIIHLSALRFSDGKKIIAEINAQQQFTLIDEEQDKDIMHLQRLN